MAWTNFPTWSVGQVSTASDWNTYVAANMQTLAVPPLAYGVGIGTSVPASTMVAANVSGMTLQGGMSISGTEVVVPVVGTYKVDSMATFDFASTSTNTQFVVFQNGSSVIPVRDVVSHTGYGVIAAPGVSLPCAAGDNFEFSFYQAGSVTQIMNLTATILKVSN